MEFETNNISLTYNSVSFMYAEHILGFMLLEICELAHTDCSRPNAALVHSTVGMRFSVSWYNASEVPHYPSSYQLKTAVVLVARESQRTIVSSGSSNFLPRLMLQALVSMNTPRIW